MIIEQISLLNFKNIAEVDLSFSPKLNCFLGNNGMGKTNLLDALYYLSFTKNHNSLPDSQLIKNGEDFAVLHGIYKDGDIAEDVYCGIKRRQKKVLRRNKKEYDRLSEHIGLLPLVMISPEDVDLIHGGSVDRRKFVDMIISQHDKEYLRLLIQYNKALYQRNVLLRDSSHGLIDDSLLEIWEEQMVASGEVLHKKRIEFLERFLPLFEKYYSYISNKGEKVNLHYVSQLKDRSLSELFKSCRERDKLLGYTSAGIHKDDFDFMLDESLIRKIGSQGQIKTYLISLKLAQFGYLVQEGSSMPILLLDDIFDKLDAERVAQIIRLVAGDEFGQIFITDTNRKYLDNILSSIDHDYKLFEVVRGVINEMK